MRKQPIHQNLNTSFVNVGALVRYLRGLQFVGSIRIELSSYEADIVFTGSNIRAREYDHIAGRISHDEGALRRILIRTKEPHGRIHVYKAVEGYAGHDDGSVFVDRSIVTNAREMAASAGGVIVHDVAQEIVLDGKAGENAQLLGALSDILRIIDESLAAGNLSFAGAFRVACDGIASEFPFIGQQRDAIVYRNGEISVHASTDSHLIAPAVFAALHPILRRLRGETKYKMLLDIISDRLVELSVERRQEFVRLGIIEHVENLLSDEEIQ